MVNCEKCGAPIGYPDCGPGSPGWYGLSDEAKLLEAFRYLEIHSWSLVCEVAQDGGICWIVIIRKARDCSVENIAQALNPTDALLAAYKKTERYYKPVKSNVFKSFMAECLSFLRSFI